MTERTEGGDRGHPEREGGRGRPGIGGIIIEGILTIIIITTETDEIIIADTNEIEKWTKGTQKIHTKYFSTNSSFTTT